MYKVKLGGGLSLLLALALLSPIAAHAQTTVTTRESNFEIIAVDGNHLVVRDQNGTRDVTVPPDFRFTVNGKPLAIGDLHAGMKGTATITTTTVQHPVYVTTIKMGKVLSQTGRTVVIKEDNGKVHRFTQSEADARGVRMYMGDQPISISDLEVGDQIRATVVSEGKPEILTAQAVDAELAAAAAAAAPAQPAAAAAEPDKAAAESPAAAPAAEPAPEPQAMEQAAPEAAATDEATAPALPKPYFKNPFFMLLVLVIVVALIWVLMRRRVKDKK